MGISTGIAISASNLIGLQSELNGYYVLFDASSTSLTSHIIDVDAYPVIITAYNLVEETVQVNRVTTIRGIEYTTPVYIQGDPILLTETNNVLVLNVSGLYRFTLSGGLGSVVLVAQDATLATHDNRVTIGD